MTTTENPKPPELTPEQIAKLIEDADPKGIDRFTAQARHFAAQNPSEVGRVVMALQAGLNDAIKLSREQAMDMELALNLALTPRKRADMIGMIQDKVVKWGSKTYLNWSVYDFKTGRTK